MNNKPFHTRVPPQDIVISGLPRRPLRPYSGPLNHNDIKALEIWKKFENPDYYRRVYVDHHITTHGPRRPKS